MKQSIFVALISTISNPAYTADVSLTDMIDDMEMRDVLLGELDECLKVMTTSLCVKTYKDKSSDVFNNEDTPTEVKELAFVGNPSSLSGAYIWQAVNYGTLSYTSEEFPTDFSDEVTLLTRE